MNLKSILVSVSLLVSIIVNAQISEEIIPKDTSYWKSGLQVGLNFNNSSFSKSWTGGGQNNIAFTTLLNGNTNYLKGKSSFNTVLELLYGKTSFAKDGVRKSQDKIYLDSKYGYSISKSWSLFASLNYLSQFDKGYDYKVTKNNITSDLLISSFASPAFFTQSVGLEYKPVSYWFIRFGLGTFRQTFVYNDNVYSSPEQFGEVAAEKAYGVERGKKVRQENFALQIVSQYNKDVAKNININARYTGFWNYTKEMDVDHRFDATITAKVSKYISTSLTNTLIYDTDQVLPGLDENNKPYKPSIQSFLGVNLGLLVQLK